MRQKSIRYGYMGAASDIWQGLLAVRLWNALAVREIQRRYRRSTIGPFWITLSMGITISGLGLLYAQLFKIPLQDYLPYLTLGFIIWGLIASVMGEVCEGFIGNASIVKQSTIPKSILILKILSTNTIIFFHNFIIYLIVAVLFKVPPTPLWLLSIVALALINITLFGMGLFLAAACARYRDITIIITNIMMLALFMTPIFWQPNMLPERSLFLDANPFYYLVECFRQPLINEMPSPHLWIGAIVITTVSLGIGVFSFLLMRKRIPFWV